MIDLKHDLYVVQLAVIMCKLFPKDKTDENLENCVELSGKPSASTAEVCDNMIGNNMIRCPTEELENISGAFKNTYFNPQKGP